MSELADWLRARLDEDEEAARNAETRDRWRATTDVGDYYNRGVVVVGGESEYHWNEMVASCGVEGLDNGESRARHIAAWDPARVLAEVAAKRRILDEHPCGEPVDEPWCWSKVPWCERCSDADDGPTDYPCLTVRLLALPYAGRDGWREEWRPE